MGASPRFLRRVKQLPVDLWQESRTSWRPLQYSGRSERARPAPHRVNEDFTVSAGIMMQRQEWPLSR